jgi:SAM-dependent methyltransferase
MIVTWSEGIPDRNMPEDILTELAESMNRHPWWRARARLALALLAARELEPPARVLDAGCGSGVLLQALEQRGYTVSGLDISRRALARIDRSDRTLIEADLSRCRPPDIEPFDVVFLLDVIEHLDDEKVALRTLNHLLKPCSLIVVSVPARPELFSEFDRVQGHRRRYTPQSLASVFDDTGLEVREILWWGYLMVPLLYFQRRRSKALPGDPPQVIYKRYLKLPPWPVPWFMRLAFAWEQRRTLRHKNDTGTSLIALATKTR